MTKLVLGFLFFISAAGSCVRDKEENNKVVKEVDGVIYDEATVAEDGTEIISTPDLTIEYKSTKAIDKLKELKQFLDKRLEADYPNERERLYEYYRTQHEKLADEVNNETIDLTDAYSQMYNEKRKEYVLTESLKAELKPYTEVGLEVITSAEELYFAPRADYYLNLFKDVNLTGDYKDYILLEAKRYDYSSFSPKMHKEIGKNVMDWENYLVKYKQSDLYIYEEAKKQYRQKITDYLFGTDDEGTFDSGDNVTIRKEFRKNFNEFIAENPGSVSAKLVKFLMDNAKTHGDGGIWQITENERDNYFNREP